MKRLFSLVLAILLLFSSVRADEGMWLLSLIGKNYQQMKALGFKLTPEDIYSINHSSMKDAVAAMDHGMCTMELVSPKGLLLTNHHCGFHALQQLSTLQNNYLRDGFWARSYQEELPVPGMTVWFLVRMEDVTNKVLKEVTDTMSEAEREAVIRKISQKLVKQATDGTDYEAEVKEMFDGNQYFLFIYKVYKDIRLVGAPPEAIGKFGGDVDNWMWPRHTGDFSIFRIYTAPDGSPAKYSPNNVPLEAKYYLPISIKGTHEGDYAQIMGFPGSTSRYLTTWEVKQVMNHENAIRIKVRQEKLNILKSYMDKDPKIRLQYASKYAGSSNYYKYSIGQNRDLKRLKVLKEKRKVQREFMKWVKADPKRKARYGKALKMIRTALKKSADMDIAQNYWFEAIYLGPEIIREALHVMNALSPMAGGHGEDLTKYANEFFANYNQQVDKDLFVNLFKLYKENVDEDYYPSVFKDIKEKGGFQAYADSLYSHSFLTDKDRFLKAIKNPTDIMSDPGMELARSVLATYFEIQKKKQQYDDQRRKGRRLFMEGYMAMKKQQDPNYLFYPDANSTERLTYGTIKGYYHAENPNFYTTTDSYDPKTHYFRPYTVIDTYLDKEKHYKGTPYEKDFTVPAKLRKLIETKDYGQYADPKLGTIVTCFLTNNDITGGNSGSPVINGEGQLIGLAFDGNWEAMSGDIQYDPALQRTICVDIRFVLFLIDKYGEDHRLIKEMKIIK